MYLSKKQIEEIAQQIASISKKDSDFEETFELNGEDYVAIVQDGVNKKISGDLFRDELQNGPRGESAYEVAKRVSGKGDDFPSEEEWPNDPVDGIKGVGIDETEYNESTAQSGISTLKFIYNNGDEYLISIKNGSGISSIQESASHVNGGENIVKINLSDGTYYNVSIRNGKSSAGFFNTQSALAAAFPSPNVGDYAFVSKAGDGTFPAYIYRCVADGTWTSSTSEYDGDMVDLNGYVAYEHNGAFDVSEYNGGTEYGSLSEAISAVPQDMQRGGMKIKYISSASSKYVESRLMSSDWNTSVNNWESEDEMPILGSENLVKSGGVFLGNAEISQGVEFTEVSGVAWNDGYYISGVNGKLVENSRFSYSDPIEVKKGDFLVGKIGKFGGDKPAIVSPVVEDLVYNKIYSFSDLPSVGTSNRAYDFGCKIMFDGYVSVVSATPDASWKYYILRGFEYTVQNNIFPDLMKDTPVYTESKNLVIPDFCTDNVWLSTTSGSASTNSTSWVSGYIPLKDGEEYITFNIRPRNVVIYDDDFNVVEDEDENKGVLADETYTYYLGNFKDRKYIRICFPKSRTSYDRRNSYVCRYVTGSANLPVVALADPYVFDIKKIGYCTIEDIMSYAAEVVRGTKYSDTVFLDVNGDAVSLDNKAVYFDISTNHDYRYDGEALYDIGYHDEKAIPFTSNFNYFLERNWQSEQNLIVTASARYFSRSSTKPTIQFTPRDEYSLDTIVRGTMYYTIGSPKAFSKKEWRCYPYNRMENATQIRFTIPNDVTLFIDDFGNYYSDKKGFDSYPILNCRNVNARGQTLSAFEQMVKIGFKYIIAVVQKSADGQWFIFHDNTSMNVLRNDDRSEIENPLLPSEYTYDELLQFDMGLTGAPYMWLAWRGQRLLLLEDFFKLCAKTGIHPVLFFQGIRVRTSDPENPYDTRDITESEFMEIKALADKYHLTKNLGLKSARPFDNFISSAYPVFGDSIESYFKYSSRADDVVVPLGGTDIQVVIDAKNAIEAYGVDTGKVVFGIEFTLARAVAGEDDPDFNIRNVVENGLSCAIFANSQATTQDEYEHWVEIGVSQFSDNYNPSVGLNW